MNVSALLSIQWTHFAFMRGKKIERNRSQSGNVKTYYWYTRIKWLNESSRYSQSQGQLNFCSFIELHLPLLLQYYNLLPECQPIMNQIKCVQYIDCQVCFVPKRVSPHKINTFSSQICHQTRNACTFTHSRRSREIEISCCTIDYSSRSMLDCMAFDF